MKVLVCGSRAWPEPAVVDEVIRQLPLEAHIIAGGAQGPDRLAAFMGRELGMEVTEVMADWEGLGKRAGYVRNMQMLDMHPDLVIAFWVGNSAGTGHTVREAMKRGLDVEIHWRPKGRQ